MYRLALIGFGNVGQGLAQILRDRGDDLAQRFGAPLRIVAVCDLIKGTVFDANGLNPGELLSTVRQNDNLRGIAGRQVNWDALTTIRQSSADVIVELSYTDLKTGEPARTHMDAALGAGKHVVTTNKGPVALHYSELAEKALANGVEIGAEGTVMSGTPALRLGMELLAGAGITRIQGILNGTTNYILTEMENGASYSDALEQAQERGYAEADPTGDVEGFDAAGKVVILANLLMNAKLTLRDVECSGITSLTLGDIKHAQETGERWKLIGTVEKAGEVVRASVRPTRIPLDHPLASVGGATNAITYTTELLGDVTLIGPGAGRIETGYALIADLLAIHRRRKA